jgi:hypothetical protein
MCLKRAILEAAIKACGSALIVFVGFVGIIGMVLIYYPDNVIKAVYWAGLWCGIAAGLIRFTWMVLKHFT